MLDKVSPGDWFTLGVSLVTGTIALGSSWMVAEYRLGEVERRITGMESRAEVMDAKAADGRIAAAADHATLKAEVEDLDNEVEGIWPRVDKIAEQLYRLDGKD